MISRESSDSEGEGESEREFCVIDRSLPGI